MRAHGRSARRLKKLLWWIHVPPFVNNRGVLLPTKHPLISEGIRKQIYFCEYEAKEVEIVDKRLSQDDIVMEVGAGIGYLSALCAKRVGDARVFAYEANPEMMEVIAATHRANDVAPTVRNVLLAEGEGRRTFYVEREFWASSALAPGKDTRTIEVEQVDLNTELRRVRPTFLIVDIEGGELEFFAIADLGPVRKICVETHPGLLTDGQISSLMTRMFSQGFVLDLSLIRKNVFYLYRP